MESNWPQLTGLVQQGLAFAWVFGWVVLFLLLKWMRDRKQEKRVELIHKERMMAMERGVPPPELPEYEERTGQTLLDRIQLNPRWPLGVGALAIMGGFGTSVALVLSGDPYHNQVWPFGLIGVFLGVGFFLQYALTRPGRR